MESRCRYTRINGARCAMPALTGHDLCFQHQHRKRQAQRKLTPSDPDSPGPLIDLVYMDDHTSVLANLNAIAEAFAQGRIDHRQLSALTHLIQTCLKTLHQKKDLEFYDFHPDDAVREVTYDDDGMALAVDPAPARRAKTVSRITASAMPERTACPKSEPVAHPSPELTASATSEPAVGADPESAASAPPPNQQANYFQTLTSKRNDKLPVFKHLRESPKALPLFSNTCTSHQGECSGESCGSPSATKTGRHELRAAGLPFCQLATP